MTINRFLLQWGSGDGAEREKWGWFVGKRHLLVTGKDTVHQHPAVFGYLFLQALMVRNSEQIIGVEKSFFCFQELRRL